MCVCVRYLGGEVPVEDALAVQILQPAGNVQGQAEPHAPRQVHVAAQQLLQVPPVDELEHRDKHKRFITPAQWETHYKLFHFRELLQILSGGTGTSITMIIGIIINMVFNGIIKMMLRPFWDLKY